MFVVSADAMFRWKGFYSELFSSKLLIPLLRGGVITNRSSSYVVLGEGKNVSKEWCFLITFRTSTTR